MINQISTWLVERINRAGQRRVDRERAQLERLQSEIITGDPEELSQVFDEDGRLWSER